MSAKKTIIVNTSLKESLLFKDEESESSIFVEDADESIFTGGVSSDSEDNQKVSEHDDSHSQSEEETHDSEDDIHHSQEDIDTDTNDPIVTKQLDDDEHEHEQKYPQNQRHIEKEQRLTFPYLTKFEKALVLGIRVQQLVNRACPMIDPKGYKTMHEIARAELENRLIPLHIKRPLPNGKVDIVCLSDIVKIKQ